MKIDNHSIKLMEKQLALDFNLSEAIDINENICIAPTKVLPGSRILNKIDPFFKVIAFMGKVYIMAEEETIPGWCELFHEKKAEWFFNYGNLRKIDYILNEYDREIIDTHVFFLPDADAQIVGAPADFQWFHEEEIAAMKDTFPFTNAFCYSITQPDYIGVAAPSKKDSPILDDNNNVIKDSIAGIAGASIDGKYVRQIGIDVDPRFRKNGLATTLVSVLKQEVLNEGFLPFYGTSESHAISRMVGIKSGFLPAFSELFIGKKEDKLTKIIN